MKKAEWLALSSRRIRKFQEIARELGTEHPITHMMGSLAWGRHQWEQGPSETLQGSITQAAALDGAFSILNTWARDNAKVEQRLILDIWYEH